jgi:hypothetical protein
VIGGGEARELLAQCVVGYVSGGQEGPSGKASLGRLGS